MATRFPSIDGSKAVLASRENKARLAAREYKWRLCPVCGLRLIDEPQMSAEHWRCGNCQRVAERKRAAALDKE